jgi:FMN-dependent NADH-azoreductase
MKMELLHLVATPRTGGSNTLRISEAFIQGLHRQHADLRVTTIDLFHHDVPAMAGDKIEAKYILMSGGQLQQEKRLTWSEIEGTIAVFLRADLYLLSVPMWNFSIPYPLKYYIDTIVQPGYTFKLQADGTPVGLASGKMVIVKTSGSDYSDNSPMKALDFHEGYLRGIFGFCGFSEIHFIRAYCMDYSPEIRENNIRQAIEEQVPAVLAQLNIGVNELPLVREPS